jgi:hypothetical protein
METRVRHHAIVAERVIADDDLEALVPLLRPSLGPTCPCDTVLCQTVPC